MKNKAIWNHDIELPCFEPLQQNESTDVLIIGGGIAGILCAYYLQNAGIDYILCEAKTICSGVTENTTAKITSQHGLLYHKLLQKFGTEKAGMYLQINQLALEKYRSLCQNIDCDFQEKNAYVYSVNSKEKLEIELEALQKIGFSAKFCRTLPLPFSTVGSVCFSKQAQFHPLKFLKEIAKELNIHENTKILELSDKEAITNRGKIRAKKMIVATHFPFLNKHGFYFLKQYQHRSYVLALKNTPDIDGMYIDEAGNGLSFRNEKNLILMGGGGHRTGKSSGGWQELSTLANRYYKDSQEIARWATQDCMTLDGLPYIGQYSKETPNLFVATGFGKWGMTTAMVSAMLLKDLILENINPYVDLFSPSRTIWRPQLAVNAIETATNLLTPTVPRCPHMGCALKWNKQERSWDCPCHGSRFSENGAVLNNPATDDKKFKN